MSITPLDRIDRQLLDALQRDARLTTTELAERVSLTPSPCARRIRRLEQEGLIAQYRAVLDKEKLGLGISIFVQVRLSQHQDTLVEQFEAAVRAMPEVINCHTVSGAFDYLLQVVSADLRGYEQWVRRLQKLPMVNTLDSSFAIRAVKENGPLPLTSR
ncbi:Lrp/AsnC family transcriptional regulator [Halomonas campisalis]|uniref:Lrp/AsnC family transcriptional regulator n=1 Tax=Billgrantia campisalis TaxID=74661 RepID=A0ABS9PC55_9GAMM|nr:Lrp/AsnC family transcriptional regulator [Halomonas campisalis]MCG6659246.1 Lrp/AsnC family transcriptional regulator [Halomonas campisalis]MDR5864245.1 Lrp/AsnC family transcriptional regulator [Halomonas campisalis]